MEPSIDKKIHRNNEQQYADGYGEKRQPSQSSQSETKQNIKKAAVVRAYLNAHPEFTPEERKPYEIKIKELGGSSNSGVIGISFEDIQALLQQLQRFQDTIGGDWENVLRQWENLCQDRQYKKLDPCFNKLSQTYAQCKQQCEEYTQFLEERIRTSKDAAGTLNT